MRADQYYWQCRPAGNAAVGSFVQSGTYSASSSSGSGSYSSGGSSYTGSPSYQAQQALVANVWSYSEWPLDEGG
jgi:hypothetical protein